MPSSNNDMEHVETGTGAGDYKLIRGSSASLEALKSCSRQPLVAATRGEEGIIAFLTGYLGFKESNAVRLTSTAKQTLFVSL